MVFTIEEYPSSFPHPSQWAACSSAVVASAMSLSVRFDLHLLSRRGIMLRLLLLGDDFSDTLSFLTLELNENLLLKLELRLVGLGGALLYVPDFVLAKDIVEERRIVLSP